VVVSVYVCVCFLCVRERESVYGNDEEEEMSVVGSKFYLLWLYQVYMCVCCVRERKRVYVWK